MEDDRRNDQAWREQLSGHAGNQPTTLIAICDAFLEEVPTLVHQIKRALQTNDPRGLRTASHTLKSCLRYVAPNEDVDQAAEVEQMADTPDSVTVDQVSKLEATATQWCECVSLLRNETTAKQLN